MFKQDYTLELSRGKINEKYDSLFPETLPNLFFIKGTNTFGKSKFMDMIAAGMYGHHRDDMPESMKGRILDLLDPNKHKLTFRFELENKSKSVKLLIEKKNLNSDTIHITEIINGESHNIGESIKTKYGLIYDIPHNPVSRIMQLSKRIEEEQIFMNNKITRLKGALDRELIDISQSLDPQVLIKKKEAIHELAEDLSQEEKKKDYLKNMVDGLEKLICLRLSKKYSAQLAEKKRERDQIAGRKTKIISCNTYGNKGIQRENGFITNNIPQLSEEISKLHGNMNQLFPKDKTLDLFIKINIYDNSAFKLPENLIDMINYSVKKLESKETELKQDTKNEYVDMCENVLRVLENYENTPFELLGKPIKEWISSMKKIVYQNQGLKNSKELIKASRDTISLINAKITSINMSLSELKRLKAKYPTAGIDTDSLMQDSLQRQIIKFDDDIKELEIKVKINGGKYETYGKPTVENVENILKEDYHNFAVKTDPNELENDLKYYTKQVEDAKISIVKKGELLKYLKEQYETMKTKKEHPHKKYEERISELYRKTQDLEKRFIGRYYEWIKLITHVAPKKPSNISEKQKEYYELMSKYLAKVVNEFDYSGHTMILEKIDFFEQKLIGTDGKWIYFSDAGSGANQVAFLRGRINTAMQRKQKMVIILDEVAMMGEPILESIFELLRDCYNQDLLLLGILLKPTDDMYLYYRDLLKKDSDWEKVAKRENNGETTKLIGAK